MPANIPHAEAPDPRVARLRTKNCGTNPLDLLREAQAAGEPLDASFIESLADSLGLPPRQVEGLSEFYSMLSPQPTTRHVARVCDGVACWLQGAERTRSAVDQACGGNADWSVVRTSCLGLCDRAPAALADGRPLGPVDPTRLPRELRSQLETVDQPDADRSDDELDLRCVLPPRAGERRSLLAEHGRIDPGSVEEAIAAGVYAGLKRARTLTPEQVVQAVERSGLRGRGGAGFPTGRKWRLVAESDSPTRRVVCNADESEPLMFKDRVLLDGNPHAVVAGIALAAYAVGADQAVAYVRGEYLPQAERLGAAIAAARARGLLDLPEGTLEIEVHLGAGAYICGEETALLESLEGRRGEPRIRPPYPAQCGLFGHPTVVNNVETLAAAARILSDAPTAGTRLFTLLGHVRDPGLVEVPLGLRLSELLSMAGGMIDDRPLQTALVGGAAGVIVGPEALEMPLDYPPADGALPMGSGGLLFCDPSVSVVELTRELLHFFEQESCGKCTPCRIGTSLARETLDRMLSGCGEPGDVDRLRQLATHLQSSSFCGLGVGAGLPLETALHRFGEEFSACAGRGDSGS